MISVDDMPHGFGYYKKNKRLYVPCINSIVCIDIENKSIYKKMEIDHNFHLSTSPTIEYYKILFPTPKYVAHLLNINESEPTSFVERTTFLDNGTIVEYIQSYKRWDYYCSKLESTNSVSPPINE